MQYKVIKDFVDLHDAAHQYRAGDDFPRSGIRVAKSRVEELAGIDNKQHTPLIALVETEEPAEQEPEPVEDETEE